MKMALVLALLVPMSAGTSGAASAASMPAPAGTGGAVAAGDPLATAAGLAILRGGGNAVDAAVATALALAVVYPEAGNLGGGGFALVRMGGDRGELSALDFRETAPARARAGMYLDAQGKPVENASLVGPLAATLGRYAGHGPQGIVKGAVAAAVEKASSAHGGVLTAADLAAYQPAWRQPLVAEAFGWKLASMPLPSSGGVILGQTLGMLEKLGWEKLPRFSADRDHLLAETFRRAFADRFLLGDPATTRATEAQLLAADWIARRAAAIDPRHATASARVQPWPGAAAAAAEQGGSETTHLSVVDREGNLVALTTTLNGLFGCGLWVPGAGFFLNNEMDDFATAPGRPNLFGLIQGEANAVGPGKRMLSSMSPVIAWQGEEAYALGGRGGSRIPTNTIAVLLNLLVDHDPLQAALDRPRLHHQWLPDRIEAEPDALAPETRAELERRGHSVQVSTTTAKVHSVHRLPGGRVEAASDPRGSGAGGVVDPDP